MTISRMESFASMVLLDEPTVKVDPIIRRSIWDHLAGLCREEGLTVVITTHYIEEVESAHSLALMRSGRIIAEDCPQTLLHRFHTNSFHDLYSKLCQIDEQFPFDENNTIETDECIKMSEWPLCERRLNALNSRTINFETVRLVASVKKNFFVMRGSLTLLLFFFIFPSLQMFFFCLSIGHQVRSVPVAVLNEDRLGSLSRDLIRSMDTNIFDPIKYRNKNEAMEALRTNRVWAVVSVPNNFSDALEARYIWGVNSNSSSVVLSADLTNPIISEQIVHSFVQTLRELVARHFGQRLPPIQTDLRAHVFSFNEFLAPGFVAAAVFTAPMLFAAYFLVTDQTHGLLDRCLSTGISGLEVVVAHLITQVHTLLLEEALVVVVTFWLLNTALRGSAITLLTLLFMQGVLGISFGLLIAAICPTPVSAFLLASGTIIPGVFLTGIIWPVQAMPRPLQFVSQSLPLTLAIECLRSLVSGGNPSLVTTYLLTLVYTALNTCLAIVAFKWRTRS